MIETPRFATYDGYCANLQYHIKCELESLALDLQAHKPAVKILAKRIKELNNSISILRQRDLVRERP